MANLNNFFTQLSTTYTDAKYHKAYIWLNSLTSSKTYLGFFHFEIIEVDGTLYSQIHFNGVFANYISVLLNRESKFYNPDYYMGHNIENETWLTIHEFPNFNDDDPASVSSAITDFNTFYNSDQFPKEFLNKLMEISKINKELCK